MQFTKKGAKQAAEGIAKGIDGVKSVKNGLQVVAPSIREAIDDKDEAITTRGKEQIAKDSGVKAVKNDLTVKEKV